jgi:hypothetical protein
MMEILQDINFYKLVISIFVPLVIFVAIFWFFNKKNK